MHGVVGAPAGNNQPRKHPGSQNSECSNVKRPSSANERMQKAACRNSSFFVGRRNSSALVFTIPASDWTHVPSDRTAPVKQLTLVLNDGKTFMVRELYIWPPNYETSQLWHDKVLTVDK